MRALLSLLLLASISSTAGAQTIQRIDITEVGIYRLGQVTETRGALGTATGEVHILADINLVQATTTIPARLGVTLGIRYRIVGQTGEKVRLKVVWLIPQPGIRNPNTGNTTVRDESDWDRTVGSMFHNGYTFDNPWEIVTGTWTYEIWDGNRKLATQSFNVVTP
jgi:hypothetical protein